MKKIIKPTKADEDKLIFSEGIDYFQTGEESVWGKGDEAMLNVLQTQDISGRWLNIAAGDGRYHLELLKKADSVVVSDIDESAISKLWDSTPKEFQKNVTTAIFDITKRFPFKNNSFEGVFCTGTLHLFHEDVLEKIVFEMDRVLKNNGKMIIDFATDIRRINTDGRHRKKGRRPDHTMETGMAFFRKVLSKYKIEITKSSVPEEIVDVGSSSYKFSCNFFVVIVEKM